MNNKLICPVCDFDHMHILGFIEVRDDDDYQTKEVIVNNQYRIPVKTRYNYRSQGNIHLLFICEDGHFSIKSFDGHKGVVVIDENILMDNLSSYLNGVYRENQASWAFNFELLGHIENFFLKVEQDKSLY
ncbi:hypothetical protein [Halalkalibacter oceani]|uniref:hypothetical protein n=1 Tax=Halalkalibacter oceani TaxID=1653776 RepID=UPI0033966A8C